MGITLDSVHFLRSELQRGVQFSKTLTLGHQLLYLRKQEYVACFSNPPPSAEVFADDFFKSLGAEDLTVTDASTYEGAGFVHDLNEPTPADQQARYTCVVDGGTIEHVFNVGQAWKNCMEMVALGGHLILMTPMNNYPGHGFYQFSPEVFFSMLNEKNGYRLERILVTRSGRWFEVRSPSEVGQRLDITSDEPTQLFISARREKLCPIFQSWPQQSDYQAAWVDSTAPRTYQDSGLKKRLVESVPWIEALQSSWRRFKHRRATRIADGPFFREIKL